LNQQGLARIFGQLRASFGVDFTSTSTAPSSDASSGGWPCTARTASTSTSDTSRKIAPSSSSSTGIFSSASPTSFATAPSSRRSIPSSFRRCSTAAPPARPFASRWPAARPAKKPTRWRCVCSSIWETKPGSIPSRSSRPISTKTPSGKRAMASTGRTSSSTCRPGASSGSSRKRTTPFRSVARSATWSCSPPKIWAETLRFRASIWSRAATFSFTCSRHFRRRCSGSSTMRSARRAFSCSGPRRPPAILPVFFRPPTASSRFTSSATSKCLVFSTSPCRDHPIPPAKP